MKRIFLLSIFLGGCASNSGIIAEGKDSYLIIVSDGKGYGFSTPVDFKISAHKQAFAFCQGFNKRPETIYEKTTQAGLLSDYSEYDLKFRCVESAEAPAAAEAH